MITSIRHALPIVAVALGLSAPTLAYANDIYTTGGVAINGFDTVAYFTEQKPVKGKSEFTVSYKGTAFHFASQSNRDTFARNPERYAPQYGGYCAYGVARGYKATTLPQAFTIVGDKLYLNYDNQVMQTWRGDVAAYIEKANTNWKTVQIQPSP